MSNTCHSTLKVYGNKVHADTARKVVAAVFGSCVPDVENQFLQTESPTPLAVVRLSSTDVPPATLVEELSAKLPDLVFMLDYAIPLGDRRGHVKFVAGTATDEYAERYLIEEEPRVEGHGTVSGSPGHVVSLKTIKEIAKHRFDQAYSCIHEEISADYDIPWKEKMTRNLQFEEYELLKSLLGMEDEEDFKRMEQHYKARAQRLAARVKAHDLLRQALERFETPEIAALLDADDHDALTRVAMVLPKVVPDFRKELATAVE
jgi:hypothetical protein